VHSEGEHLDGGILRDLRDLVVNDPTVKVNVIPLSQLGNLPTISVD
jgi:hypothetical protein